MVFFSLLSPLFFTLETLYVSLFRPLYICISLLLSIFLFISLGLYLSTTFSSCISFAIFYLLSFFSLFYHFLSLSLFSFFVCGLFFYISVELVFKNLFFPSFHGLAVISIQFPFLFQIRSSRSSPTQRVGQIKGFRA